jgi:hypothetical protein
VCFYKSYGRHLQITNEVASPLAAVHLRTSAAKRFKKVERATAVAWGLLLIGEKRLRELNTEACRRNAFRGIGYADGLDVSAVPTIRKAVD